MINITLKQLRYFDALARELHFGRAAEACSVTQPALSMQIQELENNLGLTLLERTRSGVQLTKHGVEIAARAARILADTRELIEVAQHGDQVLTGELRLGVIPSVAPYLLPPVLPALRESYPDLTLAVRETQTHTLLQELVDGKLDVLLLALPVKHADIETMDLVEDRFVLALPAGRELSGRVRATPDFVEQQRLLLLEEGHCLRDQALTYCNLQQVRKINTFGASSLATIVELVAAGYGITLLPEISLGIETRGRSLKLMRFVEPEPSRTLGLVWRATSPRKQDFIELGEIVKKSATQLLEAAGTFVPKGKGNEAA
ncbi:putative hydrogen peroxide-inducible genes activator [Candidatus Filomicrobium marinum]|uniref:LysR family transcriptional regulator, hydrogen peroxide-inducible genes activator n=2 Tax=Filomicrobium TaxID=119044 RepID=A0A1H0G250_9HYPH|nr:MULTISPECIES: hydrogen peroxide-inducible genes activator [Filomicrobium]MCV0369953.1 hydrogen peroxide-inducible genes activator [Filomicrobium sp.]CFX29394.1 putative hydrogen peroxide-inducible genes activator [Candidatus Filomicrobium marinum]CPR19815.1 putative hydrogen peroxide-inducible genes activator [Candidatus Filomicrobium marinum]SDO00963.1 LysR family transcriptional regulator, hydrogen peroxide-inducible genes activator [Filomicrobium insigne]